MLYFILFLSISFNITSSIILYYVYKEKKLKSNIDRIVYLNELEQSWQDLLLELNKCIRVSVNDFSYRLESDGIWRGGSISSLVELRKDFEKENKKRVYNYNFKKELKNEIKRTI